MKKNLNTKNLFFKNFKMYFPREVYDQIVKGSLSVEGIDVISQNSVTKANNLENQTVFIRRQREQPIECQVIRSNDLLLKEVKTGRYIRAQNHELEYVNIPEEEGTEVTFALKQQGNATLSYLINGKFFLFFVKFIFCFNNKKKEFNGHHDII
jgi:hypothetical protein